MNSTINIAEILIVDVAGILCLLFLILTKHVNKSTKRVGEGLFNCMIGFNMLILIMEILSFLIDGKPGKSVYYLQYISNAFLVFLVTMMGYIWCLYAEFKIHHSLKRVKKVAVILSVPVIVDFILVALDCFGTGLLFEISKNNVYSRGKYGMLNYLIICFYFLYSIVIVYIEKHKGSQMFFFPVYTFMVPCAIGTIVQAMQYGIVAGWFSSAIALLFLEMQLQKEESFVDELSGLYNRKYLEFFYKQMKTKKFTEVYGIMMDLNQFKKINDTYGHTVGDDAIRTVSKLLSNWVETPDIVLRFAGDEFIVICVNKTQNETATFMDCVRRNIDDFNRSEKKPYKLSFSMGCTKYSDQYNNLDEFLRDMDKKMYEDKAEYRKKVRVES